MPKKTRKEKVDAAQKRRQEHLLRLLGQSQGQSYRALQRDHPQVNPTISSSALPDGPTTASDQQDLALAGYFVSDLRKSAAVILFIIALEIALYYGTMYSYLGTILRFGH